MERSPAVLWTCLLGAGLALALPPGLSVTNFKAEPRPPQLTGCLFLTRANVTCHWKAGGTGTTSYTLQVHLMFKVCVPWRSISPDVQILKNSTKIFSCTTSDTSCTASLYGTTVRHCFCTTVTAHGPNNQSISSRPRCQNGRIEMKLPAVTLNSVKPVSHRPDCLDVTWSCELSEFSVSDHEIKAGSLTSQIQITPQGQFVAQEENVNVTDRNFTVCRLRPDTVYTIRLRHHYNSKDSPWSQWSNACQGRTGEAAPSAAPSLWRRVKQTDSNGGRLTTLLWKPLPRPLANGRVLFFNVTCQTESARVLDDHGSCRDLLHMSTSCSLVLPAGRCSCALTASTSAGTSPKAQIWLLGASETEPPPLSQITAAPLDDSRLDVRWTAPGDGSLSGFVVEWFVRERNSSVLHWEKLSSSCRALVISEGIKPLERYAVSVKALHGEHGAGQSSTVHIYTRQGAPSAGPRVMVQKLSGGRVELTWSPAPEEQLHGFIRNYTIEYATAQQPARSVTVSARTHRYSLDLSPGDYHILMYANTDAGAGEAGHANVLIGSEEIPIVTYVFLPVILTSLGLVVMACLAQNKMVKQKLCQDVPDPSNSSLAHWTPKISLEGITWMTTAEKTDMNYSDVILLSESELQNSDPDQDLNYQSGLQAESSLRSSPLQVSQTLKIYRKSESKYKKTSARAKTTSNTDLSSCPCIYSNVFFSQTLKGPPVPVLSPSYLQSEDWQHSAVSFNDAKLPLGGDSETSLQGRSPLSPSDELKTFCLLLRKHQGLASTNSGPLPHPDDVTAPQHPLSQNIYSSVPSLRPDTFMRLEDSFTTPLSQSPHSVFVDFSYCPVETHPHISPAVSFHL